MINFEIKIYWKQGHQTRIMATVYEQQMVNATLFKKSIEKPRECHNHKPQPTPATKRKKKKRTKSRDVYVIKNMQNKPMHKKQINQLPLPQARWSQC